MARLLTNEEIALLDIEACRTALAEVELDPRIRKSLIKHPELLKIADIWANMICELEHRIQHLRQTEILAEASAVRWQKHREENDEQD